MPPQFENSTPPLVPPQRGGKPNAFLLTLILLLIATGAFGVWFFTSLFPQIAAEEPQNLSVSDPLAGWKTYRNEEYGFEFKYPPTLEVTENKDKGNLFMSVFQYTNKSRNEGHSRFGVSVISITAGKKYVTPNYNQEYCSVCISSWNKKEFLGYSGYEIEMGGEGPSSKFVAIPKNNLVYLVFNHSSLDEYRENVDLYNEDVTIRNQILSTFKFISTSTKDILPPDPGEAGKATLEGIDSDKDGVRDDIQRYIFFTYPNSEKTRAALIQYAKATQSFLLQSSSEEGAIVAARVLNNAQDCTFYVLGVSMNSINIRRNLRAEILNTPARSRAYMKADSYLGGISAPGTPDDKKKELCSFDPDLLSN